MDNLDSERRRIFSAFFEIYKFYTPPLGVKKGVGFFPQKESFGLRRRRRRVVVFFEFVFVVVMVDFSTMSGVPRCSMVDLHP